MTRGAPCGCRARCMTIASTGTDAFASLRAAVPELGPQPSGAVWTRMMVTVTVVVMVMEMVVTVMMVTMVMMVTVTLIVTVVVVQSSPRAGRAPEGAAANSLASPPSFALDCEFGDDVMKASVRRVCPRAHR